MDTTASTSDLDVERADPATHPYAPSWANVLAGWLERLPGPTWAAYAVGMLLSVLVSAGQAGFQSSHSSAPMPRSLMSSATS